MEYVIVLVMLLVAVIYEYRLRKPDHFVLYESRGVIGFRTARFYPRHFSLALPGTTHLMEIKVDGTAKGSIQIQVKLAVTVAASKQHIGALIRVGGWSSSAVTKAAKELETILHGLVKEYTEKFTVEELASEKIYDHVSGKINVSREQFGLNVLTLTIQSVDPVDPSIADAMRQRESARILEQTEVLKQQARVGAAQAKMKADEQIANLDNELTLRKLDLQKTELEKESILAGKRMEDELKRNRMKLHFDKEEMELLKSNPQLLMLTPQVARLAEASQNLKNARTIVSLSPSDVEQGSSLLNMFQVFLHNLVSSVPAKTEKGEKKPKG